MNAPLTLGYSICLTPAAPAFVSRNASFPTARRTTLAAASMSITGRLGCGDVGAFSRDVNTPNSHFHVHGTTGQDRHAHGEVGGNCRFRGPHGHGSRSWRLSAVVMVGLNCLIGRNDSLSTSPEPRTTEASSTNHRTEMGTRQRRRVRRKSAQRHRIRSERRRWQSRVLSHPIRCRCRARCATSSRCRRPSIAGARFLYAELGR